MPTKRELERRLEEWKEKASEARDLLDEALGLEAEEEEEDEEDED